MEAIATKLNITEAIKALVKEFTSGVNSHPSNAYDINNGLCDQFAFDIMKKIEGSEYFWGDELEDEFWGMEKAHGIKRWGEEHGFGHCFIVFEGRYYDSEAPEGVDHPKDLPFYIKRLAYAMTGFG
jgi:hypothetical protein